MTTKQGWEKAFFDMYIFVTNPDNWSDGKPVYQGIKYVTVGNAIEHFIERIMIQKGLEDFQILREERDQALSHQLKETELALKKDIGMLRQWLNEREDRQSGKLITNDQLLLWFDDILELLK
jgi:hypothetical protein